MTMQELADKVNSMSKKKAKEFMRDIRVLWTEGKIKIDEYEEDGDNKCK